MVNSKNRKRIKVLTLIMAIMMIAMSVFPFQMGTLNAYAETAVSEESENQDSPADKENETAIENTNQKDESSAVDNAESRKTENDNETSDDTAVKTDEKKTAEEKTDDCDDKGAVSGEEKTLSKAAEKKSAEKLVFEGKGFSASLSYDEKANIPEGTKLTVKEIKEKDKAFESYYADAVKSVQKDNAKNQKTKFSFIKFYDISLINNGREIEPASDVNVEIAYAKEASTKLSAKDADDVRVIHFKKLKKCGQEKPQLIPEKDSSADIKGGHLKKAEFETDSFSVYAVAYTVDFHFENKDYSIAGKSSITLSDLFKELGIEMDVTDVTNAEFSDPSLVKVEKAGDDWKLTSLKAFSTEESLILETLYGRLVIRVTDAPAGDDFGAPVTTDDIYQSVKNRNVNDITVYFLMPDEKTVSEYSFTLPSGCTTDNATRINNALSELNKNSSDKYTLANYNNYYIYDESTGTVDRRNGRADLFKINGSVYYCDQSYLTASLLIDESDRIIIRNSINDNGYKLLDGDKIVIPLDYSSYPSGSISYKGFYYTFDKGGRLELSGYASGYDGVPTLVDAVPYNGRTYQVKDIEWFQGNYSSRLKGRQIKFSDGLLAKMSNNKNISLPEIVKDVPGDTADELSEENGYVQGNSNADKDEQIWKRAEYNEKTNQIEYTIKYFKKMHDPEARDFIFSFDESASMIDISPTEYGIKAPKAMWMVAQAQVASRALVDANGSGNQYNNRVAFVPWNDSASYSNFMNTRQDVDNWFASAECWSHIGGGSDIGKATEAVKKLVDTEHNVVILNMTDYKIGSVAASNYLKSSTRGGKFKTYAISVWGDTSIAKNYQNSGMKACSRPESFVTAFDEIIKDAIGYYITSGTKIEDELPSDLADNTVSGLSASVGQLPTHYAKSKELVTWTLGGQSPKLTAGKLYAERFNVELDDTVYSGSRLTNGRCELIRSEKVINFVDSPTLKKDLTIILKENNKNGDAIRGGEFDLYEGDLSDNQISSSDPIWRGTSDGSGKMTVPFGDESGKCRFAAGTQYTLVQTKAADGYALPAFSWKLSVSANGVITATNVMQTDPASPAGKVRSLAMASVSGKLEVYNENYSIFEISNNSGYDFDLQGILSSSVNMMNDPGVFQIEGNEWKAALDPRSFVIKNGTKITLAVPASAGKDFNLNGSFIDPDRAKEIPAVIIDQNGNEVQKTITYKDHHFSTKDYIVGQFAGKGEKVTVRFGEEIIEPIVPSGLPDLSSGMRLPMILIVMIVSCVALIMREFWLPAVRSGR